MNTAIRDLSRKATQIASGPIARGSMVSIAIKIIGLCLSFAQAVIAARLLGTEGYGLVAVALSVAQIGGTLALFGYGSLATREIAGWLSSGAQHLLVPFARHAVMMVCGLSVILAVVILATATSLEQSLAEYSEIIWICALIVPALALTQLLRGIAQGFGDVASAQWPSDILRPALVCILVIGSLAFAPHLTAKTFLALFAAAGFISVFAGGALALKHLPAHSSSTEYAENPSWIGKAAPFFGLSMLAIIQGEFATLMLAILTSPEQAGLYQPIARLTPLIALPASAAAMRYAPRISEFWNSDQKPRLAAVTRTYTLATSALTTLATLVLASLGPWLLLAFGTDFVSVAPLLWIVGAAKVFSTACGPVGYLMTMTGHTRVAGSAQLAGLVVAIVIAVATIPEHGALGAAIAVSAGLIVWDIISLIAVKRILGFDPSLLQFLNKKSAS